MTEKTKRIPVDKVVKGRGKMFTHADKMGMLVMYHRDGLTQSEIAEHYGTSRQYISKTLKKLEENINVLKGVMTYDPDERKRRKELNPFDRQKLLNEDAMEIMEGIFSLVKYRINVTCEQIAAGGEIGVLGVDLEQLNKLVSSSIPYVLPKVDNSKTKLPTGEAKTPVAKMHLLMNNNKTKQA